ncbi:MAG TPA: hypothetical protein VF519_08590 [Mycobacteriales bacterium]|jgi:hypothetical protein
MTTTLTTRGRPPRNVVTHTAGDECEVCHTTGPLALQQVGDDPDATFLLCAPCGTPAVDSGLARWL